jgi:hypothetical protein
VHRLLFSDTNTGLLIQYTNIAELRDGRFEGNKVAIQAPEETVQTTHVGFFNNDVEYKQ